LTKFGTLNHYAFWAKYHLGLAIAATITTKTGTITAEKTALSASEMHGRSIEPDS
jgi:hypothetical protein